MAESSDSVSIDIDMVPLGEKVKQPPKQKNKKNEEPTKKVLFFISVFVLFKCKITFLFFLFNCSTCCFFVVYLLSFWLYV